jgi:hypothetical protein
MIAGSRLAGGDAADSVDRIGRLHAWYRDNVMDVPLVPELERRWLAFIRQGYNGRQLARVIRWLRMEIARGRRNPGSLKLTVLLDWSEDGSLVRFAEDHALACAAFGERLDPDRRLTSLPPGEGASESPARPQPSRGAAVDRPVSDPAAAAAALAQLKRFRESLT